MNDHNAALNTRFRGTITGHRDLTMMIQSTNIGTLSNTPSLMEIRTGRVPFGGDTIDFGPLNIQFFVQEDLHEWMELYKWMIDTTNWDGDKSEILQIEIHNANKKPIIRLSYHGAIPTEVDDIQYSNIDGEEYITSGATFEFSTIEVENLITGEKFAYEIS